MPHPLVIPMSKAQRDSVADLHAAHKTVFHDLVKAGADATVICTIKFDSAVGAPLVVFQVAAGAKERCDKTTALTIALISVQNALSDIAENAAAAADGRPKH